jgi:hypothetical protein
MAVIFCREVIILDFCIHKATNKVFMNAKFETDAYGLKLKLSASNDNERVLLDELLSKSAFGVKEKNLVVRAGDANSMEVYRPIFLNKELIELRGLVAATVEQLYSAYIIPAKGDKTLIVLNHKGAYSYFVFELVIDFEFHYLDFDNGVFVFTDSGEAFISGWKTEDAIDTGKLIYLYELDNLLNKYR